MGEHFQFLREVYFFKDLSDKEISKIETLCRLDSFDKGEVVFLESSRADRFFIVLEGQVEVWKDYYEHEPDLLAVHGKGRLFGEMALIDDLPRSATVVARQPVKVLYITREDFHKIISENSSVALSIMKSVSSMVRISNENFVEDLRKRNRELRLANKELQEAHEELLKAERFSYLGKVSSLILHDIKNPISVLRSYAEMILLDTESKNRVEKSAHNIIKESERLNLLAGELLDYSRGEIRLNMKIVELDNFFQKVREHIQERFSSKQIKTNFTAEHREPVIMDEERMLRVMLNLADNARKATEKGGEFTIYAFRNGENICFEVTDTGEGMSEETKQRMFEPFYSSSKSGGTGLGMVIVKNVIDAHQGTLDVESEVGKGTKIKILLPLRG